MCAGHRRAGTQPKDLPHQGDDQDPGGVQPGLRVLHRAQGARQRTQHSACRDYTASHEHIDKGYKEVVLTGTQLGSYGFDLPSINLTDLLERILSATDA